MASDADQLMVAHLREIHAQLQGIAAKLEEHDRRFDRTDKSLEGFRPFVANAPAVATLGRLRAGNLQVHRGATSDWQQRIDARLNEIERRLAKVEEKLGI